MGFSSWLRNLTSNRGPLTLERRRMPPSFRRSMLRLEVLEDRTLLSTFTVMNLNDSGPGSLREAIGFANASPGSTINFLPGMTGTINLTTGLLFISTAMEIDGPGASVITVSGQNKTTVFEVFTAGSTDAVTINDLMIANGKATFGAGGGIYYAQGNLNLSRDTFASNFASFFGGAIYAPLFSSGGTATVTDCLFTGNHVVGPTGNFFAVGGGAITFDVGTLTVIGTKFINNTVVGTNGGTGSPGSSLGQAEGGAVWDFFDTASYTGCTFSGNSAHGGNNGIGGSGNYTIGEGQGGAIEVEGGTVQVDSSTFSANVAKGGRGFDVTGGGRIGLGLGGAIQVDSGGQLTANDSTFTGNHALGANFGFGVAGTLMNAGVGGAINDEGFTNFLTIAGSHFSGNTAVGGISGFSTGTAINGLLGSVGVGGAINLGLSASGDISGSTFSSNVALGGNGTGDGAGGGAFGGAIETFPTGVTISSSQFTNNRAQGGMGGPVGGSGGLAGGGGLFAEGGAITLLDLLFSSNRALGGIGLGAGAFAGGAEGGGLDVLFAIVNADNLTVKSNLAQGGAGMNGANGGFGDGGGIFAFFNTSYTIADSLVTLNKALGGVGASNGAGIGGGIWHLGALDLVNTSVVLNFASTSNNDIF